jgi:hypothetical protein
VRNGISSWTKLTGMTGPKQAKQAGRLIMLLQSLISLFQTLQKKKKKSHSSNAVGCHQHLPPFLIIARMESEFNAVYKAMPLMRGEPTLPPASALNQ